MSIKPENIGMLKQKPVIILSILLVSSLAKAFLCIAPVSSSLSQGIAGVAISSNKDFSEYDFKAAFIYNFAKFIEWPETEKEEQNLESSEKSDKSDEPEEFVICIVGDNPFGDAFKPVLDRKVDGRKIRLAEVESFEKYRSRHKTTAEALAAYQLKHAEILFGCDFVFLCDSEKGVMNELLRMFGGHAVVTIGETQNFAKQGGMIGFIIEDNRVRFEINLKAARKEKINIRSQMLQIARQVYQ